MSKRELGLGSALSTNRKPKPAPMNFKVKKQTTMSPTPKKTVKDVKGPSI